MPTLSIASVRLAGIFHVKGKDHASEKLRGEVLLIPEGKRP